MGVCKHWRMNNGVEVVILEDEEIGVILAGETICDACRRKLCTCERCSAWECVAFIDDVPDEAYCHRIEGRDSIETHPEQWCRDGWRQARPWTREEVDGWLGNGLRLLVGSIDRQHDDAGRLVPRRVAGQRGRR